MQVKATLPSSNRYYCYNLEKFYLSAILYSFEVLVNENNIVTF